MISKIDQELQFTKAKIGGSGAKNKFANQSFEFSKNELNVSLGNFNSSSVHSTPRIVEAHLASRIRSKSTLVV
jgi:hypothetical protein